MSAGKHTQGPVQVEQEIIGDGAKGDIKLTVLRHNSLRYPIAYLPRFTVYENEGEMQANAAFISDAFNVAHETGLMPRELAEHRKELAFYLKSAQDFIDRARTFLTPDQQGFCGHHNDEASRINVAKADGEAS